MRNSLREVPQADLTVDPGLLPADTPDYLAPLTVHSAMGDQPEIFSGQATEARVAGERIEITAQGANALTEQLTGLFVAMVGAPEVAYTMARSVGLTPDQISISDLDALPLEVFEVIAPVNGVTCSSTRTHGAVVFLPVDAGYEQLEALDLADDVEAIDPSAWAVTYATAQLAYDAEQAGIDAIDRCLTWITTRGRYGAMLLPDGSPQEFRRERARALPRRLDIVAVHGQLTGRRWVRTSDTEAAEAHFDLDAEDPLLFLGEGDLTLVQRGAIASCARAATERDPLTRLQALWEAVEYLAAGVSADRIFDPADIKRVRAAIPEDLPDNLKERVGDLLSGIASAPLMVRLWTLIEREALPCSAEEFAELSELRRTRNNAAHGREPTPPSPDQLDQATALVSRLVVARLAAGWT